MRRCASSSTRCARRPPTGSSAGSPRTRPAAPALRAAVHGWLWFMDGALSDWLEHRDMDRDRLLGLLLGTLVGAVTASGERPAGAQLTFSRSTTKTSVSFGPMSGLGLCAPYARSGGTTSSRRPPSFMPATPWSQPGIT